MTPKRRVINLSWFFLFHCSIDIVFDDAVYEVFIPG